MAEVLNQGSIPEFGHTGIIYQNSQLILFISGQLGNQFIDIQSQITRGRYKFKSKLPEDKIIFMAVQFIKSEKSKYGEQLAAEKLGIDMIPSGRGFSWTSKDLTEDEALAQNGWQIAKEKIASGEFDVIMLDNMSVEDMRSAVEIVGGRVLLEASGGISLATIGAIARTGVDYISTSKITQSAPAVDIGLDVQDTGAVLTVKGYLAGGWTDLVATDGTDSSGDTFKQDGNVTWAIPTTWGKTSLFNAGDTLLSGEDWARENLYWTRWETDTQFDSVDIVQMRALNRSPNYKELIEGQSFETMNPTDTVERIACVEALTNTGTANLLVNVGVRRNRSFDI